MRLWSTDSVVEHERLAYWIGATCDTYLPLELDISSSDGTFFGHIEAERLSTLSISKIKASPQTARRTSSNIAQSIDDNFLVSIQISGDVFIQQDRRVAILRPGDAVLYSSTRPYDLIFKEPIEQLVLMMPARVVRSRLRCADNLTARRVEQCSGASRLMLKVIESVLQTIDTVELTALPAVAASVENMVIAGLCTLNDVLAESSLDPLLLRRERIKAYILDNLREPDLSVDKIAAYFGISVSSVHRAFADEPCTLMSWVWSLRLDGARREMGDPNYANLSITDVAYGWGFSDSSHFSRVFRERFGCCPRDLRGSLGELYSRSAQGFRLDVPTTMGLP